MNVDKWDQRFLQLAKFVSGWSKDPSTQVGAVIVDDLKRVIGLGFNGFARGIEDNTDLLHDRNAKLDRMIHAEINAILNSSLNVRGSTMYLTIPPCHACANFLIQAGIKKLIWLRPSNELIERWGKSWELTYQLLDEAKIGKIEYDA